MKIPREKIVEEALRLPRESRAFLAEELLASLDYDEGFDVSSEWKEEIRRRVGEIDGGTVELLPSEQVFGELDDDLE